MTLGELLCGLVGGKKRTRKAYSKNRMATKHKKGKASHEDILRYREMLNDENYMNSAIERIADKLSEELL